MARWDFSWLTRRAAPEPEFADWDQCLDGLAERGYNCVRIDAFPHLVAGDLAGNCQERFTLPAQVPEFMWGNHTEVKIEPRRGLIEFMQKCKSRGLRVGLSSWFQDDSTHRRRTVQTSADYSQIWEETLDLLADQGLLEIVEWVDLCNEFPLVQWAAGALENLDQSSRLPLIPTLYTKDQQKLLSDFCHDAIAPLHQRFPGLRFCFSLAGINTKYFKHVDFSGFGLLEPHLWLTNNTAFALQSGTWAPVAQLSDATRYVRVPAAVAYYSDRLVWMAWLKGRMEKWANLARKNHLPLYTSEGWGPVNWAELPPAEDDREWRWVKDACSRAVDAAIELGWRGICSSNFCAPHFPGMWNDLQWHQEVTGRIRGTGD